jgi:hypothetical protein
MSSTRIPQLPVRSWISRSATATFHRGPRLAALVDGERDHGGTVLAHQRHDPGDARVGPVAVLVVDRVDDRAAAGQLEPGLDHAASVESRTSGRVAAVANRPAISRMSATPSRPT